MNGYKNIGRKLISLYVASFICFSFLCAECDYLELHDNLVCEYVKDYIMLPEIGNTINYLRPHGILFDIHYPVGRKPTKDHKMKLDLILMNQLHLVFAL